MEWTNEGTTPIQGRRGGREGLPTCWLMRCWHLCMATMVPKMVSFLSEKLGMISASLCTLTSAADMRSISAMHWPFAPISLQAMQPTKGHSSQVTTRTPHRRCWLGGARTYHPTVWFGMSIISEVHVLSTSSFFKKAASFRSLILNGYLNL